jgi:hypothetical protein
MSCIPKYQPPTMHKHTQTHTNINNQPDAQSGPSSHSNPQPSTTHAHKHTHPHTPAKSAGQSGPGTVNQHLPVEPGRTSNELRRPLSSLSIPIQYPVSQVTAISNHHTRTCSPTHTPSLSPLPSVSQVPVISNHHTHPRSHTRQHSRTPKRHQPLSSL